MAFVRKKGKSYYLVHNVREDGHVRQVHLACLGNRPRLSEEVLEQVRRTHPQLQIDWEAVRARAAETFASPFADPDGAMLLIRSMRTLRQDLEELDLESVQRRWRERAPEEAEARVGELLDGMDALRAQLEAKLRQPPGSQTGPMGGESAVGETLHSETPRQGAGD